MTEEKDFWINKDEVGALSNAERTAYKVTQDTMNKKGWYKLADDEQVVKKAVLSKEEAEWFEKHKDLPYFDGDSDDYFSQKVFDKMMEYREGFEDWEDFKDWKKPNGFHNRLSQAYFTGYTIEKEKKYYIKLNFNRGPVYLNVNKKRVIGFLKQEAKLRLIKHSSHKRRLMRCKKIRAQKVLILTC